jgi:HK97 family phage major capsid protein
MPNMIQSLVEDREKAVALIQGLTDQASDEGRDLSDQDIAVIRAKQTRIGEIDGQLELLTRDIELDSEARRRIEALAGRGVLRGKGTVEYRDAGEWLYDAVLEARGDREASERLKQFNRAGAAHILTSDLTGIVPDPILGPVLDFIDGRRPLVQALGVTPIPNGPTFHRPVLTDANLDTGVDEQVTQKTELASEKFTISRRDVAVHTYGGYVNVSRQDLDWGQNAMQIIVNQLAKRYARKTEKAAAAVLEASTGTVAYATTTNTDPAVFQKAVYEAAAKYYTNTGELPTWIATDPTGWAHLGGLADAAKRPAFPFLAPSNAGAVLAADSFAGNPIGLRLVVSYAVTPGHFIVGGPESVTVYEQRIGTLQVVEPSVLGVQVAYAGYFAADLGNAASAIILK